MDESTDRSSEKHVVFVVRYLDGDATRTSFLQIEKLADGKAKTMYVRLLDIRICSSQHFNEEGMLWFICLQ